MGTMHSKEPKKTPGLANPFIVGSPVPPSHFIGRKREMTTILENLRGPGKGSSAISGERRIGKTSLLHYLKSFEVTQDWQVLEIDHIFVYLDCLSISSFTAARFWQKVLHMIEPLVGAKLKRQVESLRTKEQIFNLLDIEQLFDEMAKAGKLVVLLLDEFDCVVDSMRSDSIDFLNLLRSLINRPLRGLALVTAVRNPLHVLCRDIFPPGSPFYNSFVFVSLGLFSPAEANELIDRALENTGIVFDEDDRDFLFEISRGYPYWLQLACSHLFEAYRREQHEDHCLYSGNHRQQARQYVEDKFRIQARPHFEELWRTYTQEEKRVLVTVARRSQEHGLVRRIAAAMRYRRLTKAFNPDLDSLVNRSLVVKTASGDFDVFSPIFAKWILSEGRKL